MVSFMIIFTFDVLYIQIIIIYKIKYKVLWQTIQLTKRKNNENRRWKRPKLIWNFYKPKIGINGLTFGQTMLFLNSLLHQRIDHPYIEANKIYLHICLRLLEV